jgi:hypothetical protein
VAGRGGCVAGDSAADVMGRNTLAGVLDVGGCEAA